MENRSIVRRVLLLLAALAVAEVRAEQVVIYTGTTQWVDKAVADAQAQICFDKLEAAGIDVIWFQSEADMLNLADWMASVTENGELDVCILYGDIPPDLYPQGNTQPDGSVMETFLETTDGDTLINHADYMFWGLNARNSEGGLQNIMDIPGIVMWDDNTPVTSTDQGREIAPSLPECMLTDRPFHLDQLAGEWSAEAILAQNAAGTRADPVIVRDGDRGRLVPLFQSAFQADPKGAVAAEIIFWLYGKTFAPKQLAVNGPLAAVTGSPSKLTLQLTDETGSPRGGANPVTVNLTSDSPTGAFDTTAGGPFNGSVTSITVPAGQSSATFFYREANPKEVLITAAAAGLDSGQFTLKVLESIPYEAGEVMIYTGTTQWISKQAADEQAQICVNKLEIAGISNTWLSSDADMAALASWMAENTGNGRRDVCVLYGDLPPDVYPPGNTLPDDSIAELFIESTDGDAIMNHADYMFWGLNNRNAEGGLRNIMDIPNIVMWDDDTPVVVTEEGSRISPSLTNYATDRPFHLDELAGEWWPELILAENCTGTRADPVVVRDGNRGRLIPVFQTNVGNEPKGSVAAEIIFWIYGKSFTTPVQLGLSGKSGGPAGKPLSLRVEVQDATGSPRPAGGAVTVNLSSSRASGAFDTAADGPFNGTIKSVSIPAGETAAQFFYRDTADGKAIVTAAAGGLTAGTMEVNLFTVTNSPPGRVAIYTGTTQWIQKVLADIEAQTCSDVLDAQGIGVTWFTSELEMPDLASWLLDSTANGQLDVCVLYGDVPPDIYPQGNTMPDGSVLEAFLESEDGDAVINHADYMFWGLAARNSEGGLQNIMDIPGIVMWDDNTPMVVTQRGTEIAPSLTDFMSDRPFHLDQLANDWFAEEVLAQNAAGTRADPVIVRDGPRGRLIPVFQTADGPEPKGQVAAEIITWLFSLGSGESPLAPSGLDAVGGSKQISLSWTAPSAGPTPTGYRVMRSPVSGGPYAKVADIPASPTSYTNTNLEDDTNYCYVVQATIGNLAGPSSNEDCARTSGGGGVERFRRADADANGVVELTDAIYVLNNQFLGGPDPSCMDAADADDSGVYDLTDAIFSLSFQFLGGPNPPDPGPFNCGADSAADTFPACVYTCQ